MPLIIVPRLLLAGAERRPAALVGPKVSRLDAAAGGGVRERQRAVAPARQDEGRLRADARAAALAREAAHACRAGSRSAGLRAHLPRSVVESP